MTAPENPPSSILGRCAVKGKHRLHFVSFRHTDDWSYRVEDPMSRDLHVRRRRLNHDWLAKPYANALAGWRSVLEGRVADDGAAVRFLSEEFPQWKRNRAALEAVVTDLSTTLSPGLLVERAPLNALEEPVRRSLGELVDLMWRHRYSIDELTKKARSLLVTADGLYRQLEQAIEMTPVADRVFRLRAHTPRFAEFHAVCSELSETISAFPHGIKVV